MMGLGPQHFGNRHGTTGLAIIVPAYRPFSSALKVFLLFIINRYRDSAEWQPAAQVWVNLTIARAPSLALQAAINQQPAPIS